MVLDEENRSLQELFRQSHSDLQRRNPQLSQILVTARSSHFDIGLDVLSEKTIDAARRWLGIGAAVLNHVDTHRGQVRMRAHAGLDEEGRRCLGGGVYEWEEIAALLQERFQVGQCYFILHGESGGERALQGPAYRVNHDEVNGDGRINDAWHRDDALPLPLRPHQDKIVGLMSLCDPLDGLRPSLEKLQAAEQFVGLAAVILE